DPQRVRACTDATQAAKQAVMLGDMAEAQRLTVYLLDSGYTEMSFMRFCEEFALCEGGKRPTR
ncbi:MAG: hypothetical protein PVF46_05585, partial [Lysobacterales bacterium]